MGGHLSEKVVVSLNWSKQNGQFGGYNTSARPGNIPAKQGTYTFELKPRDKADLGGFFEPLPAACRAFSRLCGSRCEMRFFMLAMESSSLAAAFASSAALSGLRCST